MQNYKDKKKECGQTTTEFALTLILMTGFFFFYLQLCILFAWGNYVHYATFMAARAYQAGGQSKADQTARAKSVIIKSLKRGASRPGEERLPLFVRGVGGQEVTGLQIDPPSQFNPRVRDFSWLEGVRYTFRSKLFTLPLGLGATSKVKNGGGGGRDSSVNSVTLTSESWLGREPNYDECFGYMRQNFKTFFIDNGC